MINPKHPILIHQHSPINIVCLTFTPHIPQCASEIMARGQRIRMINPKHSDLHGKHNPKYLNCILHITRLPQRKSETVTR